MATGVMADSGSTKPVEEASPKIAKALSRRETEDVTLFSFFEEISEPIKKVCAVAWDARAKLLHDISSYTMLCCTMVISMPRRAMKVVNNPKLHQLVVEEEDPEAFAAVMFGLGGALCFGSVGAVVGSVVCGALGLTVGAIPALFTFGLSLPIGAVIGGASGVGVGSAIGGAAGFTGAATAGCTLAYFRGEIRYGLVHAAAKIYDAYDMLILMPASAVKSTTLSVRSKVSNSADFTKEKAVALGEVVKTYASSRRVQVTTASAGLGAMACGTAGATGGAVCGGVVGALVGLVPAVFTFGLSIPIGAVVGGGTGLFLGGAAGTTMGFAGGGAVGFTGFSVANAPTGTLQMINNAMWKAVSWGKAAIGIGDKSDEAYSNDVNDLTITIAAPKTQ